MSNENDFAASVNRLEDLIDANQAELKRDVESIITESDRRYGSLKEELNRLKSSHPSLDQITNLLALLAEEDSRHNLSDLPDRIRTILSTITSNKHVHRQTPDLGESEISANVESVNIIDGNVFGTEGHVNGLETNVPSTGTTNDGTHLSLSKSANEQVNSDSFDPALSSVSTTNEHPTAIEHGQTTNVGEYHKIDLPEGGEELDDNQNEFLPDESSETNQNIDKPIGQQVDRGSSSQQSVRVCKRWIAEIDGEDLWYCDCGSDECRVKQEIKQEFVETGEIEIGNNDQSAQLGTRVKEEVESDQENVIGPEVGDVTTNNPNESLPEQSNGTNQFRSVADNNPIDQQADNGIYEPNKSTIDECNESQTSKQSKTRKRKRTGKSLATESENLLENSLASIEVSTPIQRSKRIRVTPLETETIEQLCAGSGFDLSNGDNQNGIDSSGGGKEITEQTGNKERLRNSDNKLDNKEGGNCNHLSQSKSANEQANSNSLGPALPSVSTAIEHDQTTDETGFNCSNYIEVYAEDMDKHQIDLPEGREVLGDNQNEHLPEESNETNQDIGALAPASSSDISVIIKVEGSSSPQPVRVCKRWVAEIDGEDLWCCDCGSDECRVKQEIKDEFDETGEFKIQNNDLSAQLGIQVKEEVESGEENVIGPEDGEEFNVNQNEYLHEESNGTNQCSVNDNQQVDNDCHGPKEPSIDECNESQTSKQSKTRKRKHTGKSLATENVLENSLPSIEMSTPIQRSKRIRMTSPLETETTEDLSTGSDLIEVDLSNGDNQNGIDSSGGREEITEQTEESDNKLDDGDGGHYKIVAVSLKCIEDQCAVMVANKHELYDHFRVKHQTSLPYRCFANGCTERLGNWTGQALAKHVEDYHSDISTWPCPHCTKTSKTQSNLYMHLYHYHFEGKFKCGYEGCHYEGIATLRSEIKKHQDLVHRKIGIHKCEFNDCGKTFNHVGHLHIHQRIHQGVKPYQCTWNMCRYTATTVGNVITHIRTQHFHLPVTQKEQRKRGIEDNRNPRDYLLNTTTHQ